MNTHLRMLFAPGALLVCGGVLSGQQGTVTSGPASVPVLSSVGDVEVRSTAITGEPYSAHRQTETFQTLADGTQINRKLSAEKLFRDSQGRTRAERYRSGFAGDNADQPMSVMIDDPVAGKAYTLNLRNHTAREFSIQTTRPVLSENSNRLRANPPTARSNPRRPKIAIENLGTQEMEGLIVDGTKTTMTFPAGAEGNDRAFDVVMERWVSKELQIIVLATKSDPRSGESTTRTTIIDRAEPDPALFQVPEDYTITKQ